MVSHDTASQEQKGIRALLVPCWGLNPQPSDESLNHCATSTHRFGPLSDNGNILNMKLRTKSKYIARKLINIKQGSYFSISTEISKHLKRAVVLQKFSPVSNVSYMRIPQPEAPTVCTSNSSSSSSSCKCHSNGGSCSLKNDLHAVTTLYLSLLLYSNRTLCVLVCARASV